MAENRLALLRKLMRENGIDIYVIPSADFHESEYVGDYFKARAWITGFTGSAGTAVVTQEEAGLWTDGRYFIQAERQIAGSGFTLFRMGMKDVPTVDEFIRQKLKSGGVIGFDGRLINAKWGRELEKTAAAKGGTAKVSEDLVGRIWTDRPALSHEKVWILPEKYAGESAASKIGRVRLKMEEYGASVYMLTSLDDIAWLLNIRGNDALHSPVVLSYLMITKKGCMLFVQEEAIDDQVKNYLESIGVALSGYDSIYEMADILSTRHMGRILLDSAKVNYRIFKAVSAANEIVDRTNPTVLMKSMKNSTEVENIRKAHVKDGVAMVKWLYWLKNTVGKEQITEIDASDRLEEERRKQEHFIDLSFNTIAAYGPNAAMMHYSATPENNAVVKPEGFLLVDSGAHYLEGSTDITRTIVVGPVTDEQKFLFTTVLRSNLNLAAAKFLYGCTGMNLDILARGPLWDLGLDYRCGTGHGIGYILNIHEAPNGFRWKKVPERSDSAVLEEGMVTSDEPGVYLENCFGIRTENELICHRAEENEYGQFMNFETVTYCPIDLEAVDTALLSVREKVLLNEYHRTVYAVLAPYLTNEEKLWLRYETREV